MNTRNVCRLLNALAECTVNEFKQAALEYICLNLETMLEQGSVSPYCIVNKVTNMR